MYICVLFNICYTQKDEKTGKTEKFTKIEIIF